MTNHDFYSQKCPTFLTFDPFELNRPTYSYISGQGTVSLGEHPMKLTLWPYTKIYLFLSDRITLSIARF